VARSAHHAPCRQQHRLPVVQRGIRQPCQHLLEPGQPAGTAELLEIGADGLGVLHEGGFLAPHAHAARVVALQQHGQQLGLQPAGAAHRVQAFEGLDLEARCQYLGFRGGIPRVHVARLGAIVPGASRAGEVGAKQRACASRHAK
jgi:hypothetical protein